MDRPTRALDIEGLFAPLVVRAFSSHSHERFLRELRDEERTSVDRMAVARQAEFATARACARAALREFDVDAPVPRRSDGSPEWPAGMVGSISHTRGFCLAIASGGASRVGIDVEEIERMKPAIERRVLIEGERARAAGLDEDARRRNVAAVFAAKEAFYKAHYEIEPRYLGFDAVEVTVEGPTMRFAPGSGDVNDAVLARTRGRLVEVGGRVVVGVVIDPDPTDGPLPSPA